MHPSVHQIAVFVQFIEGLYVFCKLKKANRLPEMYLLENRVVLLIGGCRTRFRRLENLIELCDGRRVIT